MKILMLSTDSTILEERSDSRERMIWYGSAAEEMHIILPKAGKSQVQISKNVWVYSTNSRFKIFYPVDAYKIGKQIISNFQIPNSLVTAQDPFLIGLVGYFLKLRFGLLLQLQIHTDFLSPYFWKESLKNKARVLLAKWLMEKADCVRVVSGRIKDSLVSSVRRQASGLKISVLPVFVDIAKIRNQPVRTDLHKKYPDYDFIILMASRLTREKNIGLAIEAICDMLNSKSEFLNPKPLLLIVGSGPEEKNLKQKTKNCKLTTDVVFEPWTDDITSYYKTADLFLLTSDYEGYGRTVVEAAAAGLPVIMTDVGISVGKATPVGDKKALVESLKEMISNPAGRKILVDKQS